MKDIIRILKRSREVRPDPLFVARSRSAILSEEPRFDFSYFLRNPFVLKMSVASAVLVLLLLSFLSMPWKKEPTLSSLHDSEKITNEFRDLDISIHLKEITYQKNAGEVIVAAIDEIIDSKTKHLNKNVLQKESNIIDSIKPSSEENIDELLERVIF